MTVQKSPQAYERSTACIMDNPQFYGVCALRGCGILCQPEQRPAARVPGFSAGRVNCANYKGQFPESVPAPPLPADVTIPTTEAVVHSRPDGLTGLNLAEAAEPSCFN